MSAHFSSPNSTAHPGLYVLNVTGTGLGSADAAGVTQRIGQEGVLASAIAESIRRARASGLTEFAPADGLLPPPSGMNEDEVEDLFQRVLGLKYQGVLGETAGYRALSLSEWSDAAMALQRDSASLSSRLAPGQGGGVHYADGRWYINGQTYTLAESFLALRVSVYGAMDQYLSEQMNRANLNTMAARKVVGLLTDLNATYAANGGSGGSYSVADDLQPLLAQHDLSLTDVANWGSKVVAGGNFASVQSTAQDAITSTTFAALITEAKAIFESINAENQVSQVRLDSMVNARDNVISGLNNFMKGYAAQQSALSRLVGGTLNG